MVLLRLQDLCIPTIDGTMLAAATSSGAGLIWQATANLEIRHKANGTSNTARLGP